MCATDPGLELSGLQADTYAKLYVFLMPMPLTGLEIGTVTQALCCFLWFMSGSKEFSRLFNVARAVVNNSGSSLSTRTSSSDEDVLISNSRVAIFIAAQVCRFAVLAFLIPCGIMFLVSSESVADVLLNALVSF